MELKVLENKKFVGEDRLGEAEILARKIFNAYSNSNDIGIKGKDRVKELGEVFTPDWVVRNMMDIKNIYEMGYCLAATFLEPSCGTGNFLVEILARKLAVATIFGLTEELFNTRLVIAVSTIYGVEIMLDNVVESRSRMLAMCEGVYKDVIGDELKEHNIKLYKTIKYIIDRNIIFGNMLTFEMASYRQLKRKTKTSGISLDECNDTVELKFSEWIVQETDEDTLIKRVVWSGESPDILLEDETDSYEPIPYLDLYTLKDYIE